MTVLNINNMYITTIADSYVQINYSLSLSLLTNKICWFIEVKNKLKKINLNIL